MESSSATDSVPAATAPAGVVAAGHRAAPSAPPAPKVSVLMPAYNAGDFLVPAIESILAQSERDFEFIIIDDGSTDGTRERIAAYAARDARIRDLPNARNLGVTRTLNRGLTYVRSPWVARMDADDLSHPHRLARQLEALTRQPAARWSTSPFDIIDNGNRITRGWRGITFQPELLPFFLLFYNRLNAHGQVMFSTELVRSLGGYDEKYHLSEATELWLRLTHASPCAVVDAPLYAWRADNPHSVTKQNRFRYAPFSLLACREAIARHCGLEISESDAIALRDFWVRYHEAGRDWTPVEHLLLKIAAAFQPPRTIPGWTSRVRQAIAGGWMAHAALHLRNRDWTAARAHLQRARRAAGRHLPAATWRFGREAWAVRGQLARRA